MPESDSSELCAYIDESCCTRSATTQEYLIGAALIEAEERMSVREELRPLLLPGQLKVHWTDESHRRRKAIVDAISSLGTLNVVISRLSSRSRKTERSRRKCLETLYAECQQSNVHDLTLESRSAAQDKSDRAHIVACQAQGYGIGIRLHHLRGGDEPSLWIADAVLGAINAGEQGETQYINTLRDTIVLHKRTPDSLPETSERP